MKRFRHRVVVAIPAGGHRDPSGRWIVDPETVLYDGPADVQDAPVVLSRDVAGVPTLTADGTIVIPCQRGEEEIVMAEWKPGLRATDYFDDVQRDAEILRVTHSSATADVRFA